MKRLKKIIAILIVVFLVFEFWWVRQQFTEGPVIEDLNLQMTGVVLNVETFNGYNGTGVIQLKILSSNISKYNPQNELENYYCIINDGKAEIYDGHSFSILEGDTVRINTKSKEIHWKDKAGKIHDSGIWLNTSEEWVRYLRSRKK